MSTYMSEMMTAVQMIDYENPLEIRDVPIPEIRDEQVLVKIEASGLYHSDIHLMDGLITGLVQQFPLAPS